MKFLVAPSPYKGTYRAGELADAIGSGIRRAIPQSLTRCLPLADGGDGTIEAIAGVLGGKLESLTVPGPTGAMVEAAWLCLGEAGAVVELASASGIAHLNGALAPLDASTIGTGCLLADCLDKCQGRDIENIVLTVGGSASTDGGTGILQALGARFLDGQGRDLRGCGRNLEMIETIDLDSLSPLATICATKLLIATDVTNPLLGDLGAARIFAPQKGADPRTVELLEKGMRNFADRLESTTGRSARAAEGAGAAGGVPFGLMAALGARLVRGFSYLDGLLGIEAAVAGADIVVTAEGRLDSQSLGGKAAGELAALCRKHRRPLWVIPASLENGIDFQASGISAVEIASTTTGQGATLRDVEDAAFRLCLREAGI
ncbi:MAG: glycerate kinase [Candidatus Melainabacteria bacterium]|nr:glycerate kinase [Candidatus Melainabacteria bacterium]